MIGYFTSKTPLVVEYERNLQKFFKQNPDKSAFMKMCMYQVGLEPLCHTKRFEKKEDINIRFVPGGAGFQLLIPGDGRNAMDNCPWHIPADMVCYNFYVVSQSLENSRLFVNPYMTTPVSEKWGRRDHKDFVAPITQNSISREQHRSVYPELRNTSGHSIRPAARAL